MGRGFSPISLALDQIVKGRLSTLKAQLSSSAAPDGQKKHIYSRNRIRVNVMREKSVHQSCWITIRKFAEQNFLRYFSKVIQQQFRPYSVTFAVSVLKYGKRLLLFRFDALTRSSLGHV